MDKLEIIRACKEQLKYENLIDEIAEIIDWGTIVEFILLQVGISILKEVEV